jgi:hypothetical protein
LPLIFFEQGLYAKALSPAASASTHSSWFSTVQKFPVAAAAAIVGLDMEANPNSTTISSQNLFMSIF